MSVCSTATGFDQDVIAGEQFTCLVTNTFVDQSVISDGS